MILLMYKKKARYQKISGLTSKNISTPLTEYHDSLFKINIKL